MGVSPHCIEWLGTEIMAEKIVICVWYGALQVYWFWHCSFLNQVSEEKWVALLYKQKFCCVTQSLNKVFVFRLFQKAMMAAHSFSGSTLPLLKITGKDISESLQILTSGVCIELKDHKHSTESWDRTALIRQLPFMWVLVFDPQLSLVSWQFLMLWQIFWTYESFLS